MFLVVQKGLGDQIWQDQKASSCGTQGGRSCLHLDLVVACHGGKDDPYRENSKCTSPPHTTDISWDASTCGHALNGLHISSDHHTDD